MMRSDRSFQITLAVVALFTPLLLILVVGSIGLSAREAFHAFGFGFFTTTIWDPVSEIYGAGPVIFGTLVTSFLALLFATPISVAVALYLTEVARPRTALIVGFAVEMLAAIPSVVYGLWGIFVLAPILRLHIQPWFTEHLGFIPLFDGAPYGVGMLTAGIILAIMITPTIAAICREVFRAVPILQREAALGLGATRWEMMHLSVLKSSKRGIFGATVLGLGRAMGETMAVTMVIGNRAEISASLFAPAQTLASVLANEYAEATTDLHVSALAAVGFTLFLVSFFINAAARFLIRQRSKAL